MRRLTASILLACSFGVGSQTFSDPEPPDPDLLHAWPAWLLGDHVEARSRFLAAASRGHPLGQYNLAMMLMHGEGGPPSPAEACALLRMAAVRVELARAELQARSECGPGTRRRDADSRTSDA